VSGIVGRWYLEDGKPVQILIQWGLKSKGESYGGPRNVMIYRRADRTRVVRPFRGLRLPDPRTFLMVHNRTIGWPISFDNMTREWSFLDTGEPLSIRRRCPVCDERETPDGHDPCIANLPDVFAACCGHGLPCGRQSAYVMFKHPKRPNEGTFNGTLYRGAALDFFAEHGREVPEDLDAAALQRVRDAFPGMTKG
jgi:hypothetical protein